RSLSPHGADRLHYLVVNDFFTGARFFRVVRGFAAQFGLSGIPAVDKSFDIRPIPDDRRKITNAKGTLVFAAHGPNSRSTQLFINTVDNGQRLDAQGFAPVGRVVRGMDVVEQLESGYGETSNTQGRIMVRGNDYLRVAFPELDSIVRATVK
ncbi:MAG: peptidylprolyl isomerase, partial [Gemmatimonadaceae bacterium]